jgi:L-arabinose isomerase
MMEKLIPRIGLLATGHQIYWGQFPGLMARGLSMLEKLEDHLKRIGELITGGLVDTAEKATEAAELFKRENIDILLIFPLGYTTGMCIAPVVKDAVVPIRIVNAHEDAAYDYQSADTEIYLHHEGVCCIPEYASTLVQLKKRFRVITGHFGDERLWVEIRADCMGAAAAKRFSKMRFAVIGNTYTGMTDMPTDESRVLRATGALLVRPEVEEIAEAFHRATDQQTKAMLAEFRRIYDVEESVTDDHMRLSARIAVAFDEVVNRHRIDAFGYFWWGEREETTQLRAQSALAVSRLAAMGRPGVTEGDVKTAMAMKILELLGGGGMFLEFFSMDFKEDFLMMGHDGPANIAVSEGKPNIKHLSVHHGKTGHGIGIDFHVQKGRVTLVNLTQFGVDEPFKLIYTVGEAIEGEILNIGNPNCRIRLQKPIHEFIDEWCRQGPSHHMALGIGDHGQELEAFAEAMGFSCVKI